MDVENRLTDNCRGILKYLEKDLSLVHFVSYRSHM